ncbi:hypothetical protein G6F23_015630 [Rhizopus arrhizus]|nr:hypothetical protein G6F23_015630 [Rhizopus arrhizus]
MLSRIRRRGAARFAVQGVAPCQLRSNCRRTWRAQSSIAVRTSSAVGLRSGGRLLPVTVPSDAISNSFVLAARTEASMSSRADSSR